MTAHPGSCHCGAVRFEVDWPLTEATSCDCSLCVKRNAVMVKVPEAALTVTDGADRLTLYQWNTLRAEHHFCSLCGIYLFHRKRSAPDHFGVNLFALDGFDAGSLRVVATEGASMTLVDPAPRPEWRGPRPPIQ